MADGQVVFDITGNNQPIQKSLSETTTKIQQESKKWDQSVDDSSGNISGSLIGAFKAVVGSAAFIKIGQMLLQLGGESIQLASDLEEVQNVVDVTFGTEGAKKIESWAKAASSQFGLTELQAKQYSATLGAMMKSNGMTSDEILDLSTNLAGLAADMASFYNMDFDTAFSKIQSAMSGMTLPMRQLGIDMTEGSLASFAMAEGMETAYSKMSEQEQMLVRYRYLMSVTADAQGDFARTSDSFANSQRRMATGFDTLKAQLGQALLPIATTVSNAINDLLDILTYVPPETAFDVASDSINDAVSQATQAQGILGYMDKLYEKYGDAATKTEEWATALESLKKVMPEVNQFISDETGELTKTNEQLRAYIENRKQALIEEAKANAIKQLNDEYMQAGVDYYTQEINRDLAQEQANSAVLSVVDYIIAAMRRDMKAEGLTMEDYGGAEMFDRDEWLKQYQSGAMTFNDIMEKAYFRANMMGDDTSTLEEYERIYSEQTAAADAASASMKDLDSKMKSLQADLDIANQALERLSYAANTAASTLAIKQGTAAGITGGLFLGSFDSGLDYVPKNGFAYIHQGERIQTAAEASLARMMGAASPAVDYGSIGAAMWSNAPKMGGNVYLDGRTVGQVLSDIQGRNYRTLQRSGWQA